MFVDSLVTITPLETEKIQQFQQQLHAKHHTQTLAESASAILSDITQLAGIVSTPTGNKMQLRQVEFLSLSGNRVLVILVFNNSEVQNRVIHTDRPYSAVELTQAANYLTEEFCGSDLASVHQTLIKQMDDDRQQMNQMMQAAIEMADKAFIQDETNDFVMAGETNLLGLIGEGVADIKAVFDAFNEKRDILHLLDQSLHSQGIQIFIGEEYASSGLNNCSVVTAPYSVDGEVLGALGVIGPTRMPYDRVIPIVDITAKLMSAALDGV